MSEQGAQQGLLDMGRHQIDADPLLRCQLRQVSDHLLQQLFGHRQDQSLLLCIFDKGTRGDQLVSPLPAQQRLESHHLVGTGIHYRLVEGNKFPADQPCLQQSLEGAPIAAQQPVCDA